MFFAPSVLSCAKARSGPSRVRAVTLPVLVLSAVVALAPSTAAQTTPSSLFERYLEALRAQAGIPGLSAAIVQDGRVAWEIGLGLRDVEAAQPALADTPYPVADLTGTLSAALVLRCAENGQVDLNAPMRQWTELVAEGSATVRHALSHTSAAPPGSAFKYDPSRFAALTPVVEGCAGQPFRKHLDAALLDRFAMIDALPGLDLADPQSPARADVHPDLMRRYESVLLRLALPYKVEKGRATRSDYPPRTIDAAMGLVASVRDLARFDAALDTGAVLQPETLSAAWTSVAGTAGTPLPFGLGWFVQAYNGERLVWHYGLAPNSFSSLVLKVPSRRLTLILLANSDGLSAPFALNEGDVTTSPFARLFLRLFLP